MRKILITAITLIAMTSLQSCKEKIQDANPLLAEWDTPFGVPPFDRIEPSHYGPAVAEGIARHNAQVDSIVAGAQAPSFENVIAALDRSGGLLRRTYTTFSLVAAADNNDELQRIDLEISPAVAAHYDSIYMNDKLFDKVKTVHESLAGSALTPEQKRLTEKIYRNFIRSGAALTPRQKEQLANINRELTTLGIRFGNNMLAENKDFVLVIDSLKQVQGLPESAISAAFAEGKKRGLEGKWVFTLGKPSLIPFLTYVDDRLLREKLYKGYLNRCNNGNANDNKEVINDIVRLRTEKAHLLGYPSYAAYVLDDKMAKTPENVYALLDKLWTPALALAKEELAEMKQIKATETQDSTFASWDWWYYAEKVRKNKYDLDEEMLRPFLSLDNVRSGVFQLSNRLWGLTFRPITAPVYNKECMVYEVLDRDNTHLGVLYFDFFPREGKQSGAWCGTYRDASYTPDGKRIAPVVTVVCNFTRPTGDESPLLSLDETQTLFHEFGHALHSLFSQVRYTGVGEVERDFVELPSQIMENWAVEPQMLRSYAKNFQTGNAIPDHLIDRIRQSRSFNQGFAVTELLAAALLDMDIHTPGEYSPIDLPAFEREALSAKRGLIPQIEPRYRYPYFGHIFNGDGYSAGYYSYIWAEVYDKDAFHAFVESGDLFDRELARSFRRNILEKGGSEDGNTLYRNFRGKDPDILPMLVSRGLAPAAELAAADSVTRVRMAARKVARADSLARIQAAALAAARADSSAVAADSVSRDSVQ